MRPFAILPLGALLLVACTNTDGNAPTGPAFQVLDIKGETQVTTDPADQFDPHISGTLVVYSDRRGADADVWVHDVVSGIAAPVSGVGSGDQLLTGVWGTRVVFTDFGTGNAEIWTCEWNGSGCPAQQVTINPTSNQRRPDVFDSFIVYEDDRAGDYDVYLYDLAADLEVQLTSDPSHQRKPRIFGNRILWEDYRFGTADVYTCVWDGTTCDHQVVAADPAAHEVEPDIFGDIVVFGSNRDDLGTIYMVDIATTPFVVVPLTPVDGTYQRHPKITGTYVAYEDYSTGDANIRLYDVATGQDLLLTTDPAEQYLHAVSGTRTVYTDNRNDNLDIYMTEITVEDVPAIDEIADQIDVFVDDGSITNNGIGQALSTFLDQIEAALSNGDTASACARLNHFIGFVEKKAGKQIDADAAQTLIDMASALVGEYCG